ncbi:beta strand repeat-containing protein, partial [Enterococcus larvae]|uniref:beta strand repeat-containing protein n=1 Tax=Enterococcus larvae TaxID=2794352 RepID=UPI003F364B5E
MKLGKKSLLAALSLIFLSVGFAGNAEAAVTDTSISGELAGTSATSLVVVPSPDGSTNKEYASTAAGLKQALFDLYQKNDNGEYAIYIGTNITNLSGAVDKNPPASPNAADMTFSALEGRIKTLVLTTTTSDIISNNTGAATGAKTVTFGTNAYMGTNVILRNITYTGTNLYMNGHDLSLNGNSQGNGLSVFGGSDTSNVTGSPTITVNATGTGTWNFYGGNNTGGTLNGSTSLVFNNTTGNVTTIAGGARVGTVTGNVDVKINDFGGSIANYYGGGMGTGTSATANVGGNVTTTIDVQNASTKLSLSADVLYGGVQYGNITGTISNTIKGYGSFNGNNTAAGAASPGFIGGSREGNIGSDRTVAAITNDVDTSNYSAGSTAYSGGNNVRGTITGAIKNTVKAGGYRKGSFNGVYGGGSRNIDRLTAALLGTSGSVNAAANTNFDNLGKDARRAKAESAATFRVYGDITLDILAGVVSVDTDPSYTRAAGYGGYIEGDTTVTLGTLNEDGSTGGAGMVYSQYTHTNNLNNTDYDKTKNRRSYNTGYDVVGGGGSPGDSWSIYIYGRTKTVMNNVVARWTYGGNFSGVVEHPDGIDADTYASEYVMNAGIVDTTEGTGYIGQRTYGPSHTQINNGQVDWFTSGGGWWDWKQFGDASVEFVKGIHNGTVGGTYGYSGVDNH